MEKPDPRALRGKNLRQQLTNLGWTGSFDALLRFGKGLVLVAVAAGPWLPAILVLVYLAVRGIRRARRTGTNAAP